MAAARSPRFDPALIAAQMVALQCIFYASLGMWAVALEAAWGVALDVDLLFDSERLRGATASGKVIMMALLINSFVIAWALAALVRRAKQVLDFSATLYLVHLLFCTLYGGFPRLGLWWLVQAACFTIQTLLGEYICVRRELQELPMMGATTVV